jgi:hypothetical protein
MATRKKAARKTAPTPRRSPKAGRPPQTSTRPARVKRRAKSAHAAVKKDTMLVQTERDPRARWSGSRPAWKKR